MIKNIIKNKDRVILFAYIGILLFLSLKPPGKEPQIDSVFDFAHADKIKHFIAYFILSFLLLRFFHNAREKINRTIFIAILLGVLIEILQIFVGREFDILDMIVNGFGAWGYCFFFQKYGKNTRMHTRK
ncbi:VanZ family protein [Candidatus Uabimicrobium amorphum]|uniref:VanZ-like domain-containing protein n=1 Tax=Uabimicrobium amorphum TaxID=2596890 RepID=A0A5S9INS6_UABAM|nr:VanZ family protein [Candidatus Uabimicrobium amorphum]BBM84921.1 hypothetical protein UABAM_03282 [Candidatus Uabimicrobium amorphum]